MSILRGFRAMCNKPFTLAVPQLRSMHMKKKPVVPTTPIAVPAPSLISFGEAVQALLQAGGRNSRRPSKASLSLWIFSRILQSSSFLLCNHTDRRITVADHAHTLQGESAEINKRKFTAHGKALNMHSNIIYVLSSGHCIAHRKLSSGSPIGPMP